MLNKVNHKDDKYDTVDTNGNLMANWRGEGVDLHVVTAGVYPATPYGGELPPPWNKVTPPEKDHKLPRHGEYLFRRQLTRPLHANILLQH